MSAQPITLTIFFMLLQSGILVRKKGEKESRDGFKSDWLLRDGVDGVCLRYSKLALYLIAAQTYSEITERFSRPEGTMTVDRSTSEWLAYS